MATSSDILKKKMLQSLEKSMGVVTSACKKAKIARSTHYDWMEKDPEYKAFVDGLQDVALDFAESKLMQSINRGSDTATIFYLKTKGKKRGYIEKTEVQHEGIRENAQTSINVYTGNAPTLANSEDEIN